MNQKPKLTQNAAIFLIAFYRETFGHGKALAFIAPFSCRFYPSCSKFAQEAILKYGTKKGIWLTIKRLISCVPFGKSGYDPVK